MSERQCLWTHDECHDAWDTACGEKWQFNDGGPRENGARFCMYCGGEIMLRDSEQRKAKRERYLKRRSAARAAAQLE